MHNRNLAAEGFDQLPGIRRVHRENAADEGKRNILPRPVRTPELLCNRGDDPDDFIDRLVKNADGDSVSARGGFQHERRDRSDIETILIDGVDDRFLGTEPKLLSYQGVQSSVGTCIVDHLCNGPERFPADRIAASFIPEHAPPSACTDNPPFPILPEHNRSGTGNKNDARRAVKGPFKGNACVAFYFHEPGGKSSALRFNEQRLFHSLPVRCATRPRQSRDDSRHVTEAGICCMETVLQQVENDDGGILSSANLKVRSSPAGGCDDMAFVVNEFSHRFCAAPVEACNQLLDMRFQRKSIPIIARKCNPGGSSRLFSPPFFLYTGIPRAKKYVTQEQLTSRCVLIP